LLEREIGKDGWGPLCEFLGVEQPEGEFPRVNETKAFDDRINVLMKLKVLRALRVAAPWVLALGVVAAAVIVGFKRGGLF
jgi:Sulfotransferase domain